MKNKLKTMFLLVSAAVLLTGCKATELMYQISTITPTTDYEVVGNKLLFQSPEVNCWYDFWNLGGSTSVEFQNLTDSAMVVILPMCSYTLNENVYPFYDQLREAAAFDSLGYRVVGNVTPNVPARISAHDTLLAQYDPKCLLVPPHSTIAVQGFLVNGLYLDEPDLRAKPKERQGKMLTYTKEESPFVFSNSLSYAVKGDSALHHVRQDFFVSQVTNLKSEELYTQARPVNDSGAADTTRPVYYCPYATPNHYYVAYNPDDMPHNYSTRGLLYLTTLFVGLSLLLVMFNQ